MEPDPEVLENSTWSVNTVVEQKKVTWKHFTWTVRHYLRLKLKTDHYSQVLDANKEITFVLQKTQTDLSIRVHCDVSNRTLYFCIYGEGGKCIFNEAVERENFVYHTKFSNEAISDRENGYLRNGTLVISCRYISQNYLHKNIVLPFGKIKDITQSNQVCRDLRNMYIKSVFCDFWLRADTKEFPVHKSVLSARSPFLAEMLKHLDRDVLYFKEDLRVDADIDVLNDMILYMYSAELPDVSMNKVFQLMELAYDLDIPSLRKRLFVYFRENFTEENVFFILKFAARRPISQLTREAFEYITLYAPHLNDSEEIKDLLSKDALLIHRK